MHTCAHYRLVGKKNLVAHGYFKQIGVSVPKEPINEVVWKRHSEGLMKRRGIEVEEEEEEEENK